MVETPASANRNWYQEARIKRVEKEIDLILLGTVHGDPWGYARAWKWLEHLRPDCITVEISRFSINYRERLRKRWGQLWARALDELPPGARQHLALRRVASQVAMPFEYRAARDWGHVHQVPWMPLDHSALAREHLPRYAREVLTPGNLRALLETPDGDLGDFVRQEYNRARFARERRERPFPFICPPEARRREELMARRLKRLAWPGRRVVHLGGWEHAIPWADGMGLIHWLEEVGPLCLLLDEVDGF